jgi:hypothetical protein
MAFIMIDDILVAMNWRWACQGCDKAGEIQSLNRYDAYGIPTGAWCDDCYNDSEIYPYHKDEYFDPTYAGESLEEDY